MCVLRKTVGKYTVHQENAVYSFQIAIKTSALSTDGQEKGGVNGG